MDKVKLLEHIRTVLEKDLKSAKQAALATYEAATHEESKPENEYDTRGLEASYLAGAQAKRVAEIEELLVIYKHLIVKNFTADDKISATALVEVEYKDKRTTLFILPKGGGLHITFEGLKIQTISPNSPLGEALLNLHAGDVALVENGPQIKEYEILSIK